jgi:hypothetical protein
MVEQTDPMDYRLAKHHSKLLKLISDDVPVNNMEHDWI